MKFRVDAQMPRKMVHWFTSAGCDAVHALDLPDGNRTPDVQLIAYADQEQCVVVTKDADFVNEHVLNARPAKLLLVSTGNISNRELEHLVVPLIAIIDRAFQIQAFLELGQGGIIIRA